MCRPWYCRSGATTQCPRSEERMEVGVVPSREVEASRVAKVAQMEAVAVDGAEAVPAEASTEVEVAVAVAMAVVMVVTLAVQRAVAVLSEAVSTGAKKAAASPPIH